ncbi:MAG: argininosuccinate lyase [Candidatus Caldarchaeum sp.]
METAPHRKGIMEKQMDRSAASYTSSSSFDTAIADSTIYVNIAHIRALEKLGVVSKDSAERAVRFLSSLLKTGVKIPEEAEDIHIVVESALSNHVPEVGEMLALGKSRNDAVVAAVKIKLRQKLYELGLSLLETIEAFLTRSVAEAVAVFPVYTHLQRAAPASFGFVLQSYAVRLLKTYPLLETVLQECKESPLGSGPVAGTSVPLDRQYVAGLLGFSRLSLNALEATASRDFLLRTLALNLAVAVVLSSFAEELVVYSSEEFGLLRMPEELSATSSIMPQKRNPVVAEVMRTKAAEALAGLTAVAGILARQPSGYNLDLQQTTPKIWVVLDQMSNSLDIARKLVNTVEVDYRRAFDACRPPTAAVELANYLSLSHGISFRKAHSVAGKISRLVALNNLNPDTLAEAFEGLGLNMSVDEVMSVMEPVRTLGRYSARGSANPDQVREVSSKLLEETKKMKQELVEERDRYDETLSKLLA